MIIGIMTSLMWLLLWVTFSSPIPSLMLSGLTLGSLFFFIFYYVAPGKCHPPSTHVYMNIQSPRGTNTSFSIKMKKWEFARESVANYKKIMKGSLKCGWAALGEAQPLRNPEVSIIRLWREGMMLAGAHSRQLAAVYGPPV